MIPYLLTSSLLSLISWTIYVLLLKKKASPIQQKGYIYFSLLGSLLLPIVFAHQVFITHENHQADYQWEIFKTVEHEVLMRHCACETPNYTHRFFYKADSFYHFLLDNSFLIKWFILTGLFLVGIKSFLELRFLYLLSRHNSITKRQINGRTIYLITVDGQYPFAAFYLDKPFIIVPTDFQKLNSKSQTAVLAHEFSHIQQRNTWETIILRFIQCIWLLNPVFYYFRKELSLISECIADQCGAEAINSKKAYAHLLISLKNSLTINPLSHGFAQKSLKVRVQKLCVDTQVNLTYFGAICLLTFTMQILSLKPAFSSSELLVKNWQTYEKVYTTYPDKEAMIYCTDCEQECE